MIKARSSPRTPSRVTLRVDALDEEGAGVGTLSGQGKDAQGLRVHVPYALPGDVIEAEIEHRSPHRPEAWGALVKLERPSPDRVHTACAAFGRCGGCSIQHLAYERQLEWKRRFVVDALAAAGVNVEVAPTVAHPTDSGTVPLGYRNRSKLVFARRDGRVVLGAFAPRSHDVVDLAGCRVVTSPLDDVARTIADLATRLGVSVYDERTAEGVARYAILRAAHDGSTQVMLVVARRGAENVAELARALRRKHPEVVGVVENLQPSRGNALVGRGEPDIVLDGSPDIVGDVGVRIRLSPRAFFQASWAAARKLYADVANAAALRPGDSVVELYAGVGGIALTLASREPGAIVVGIEEVPEAVDDATADAALNAIRNARFECGDAAKLITERALQREHVDVLVVDPPRKGLDPAVLGSMKHLQPRTVVYVSCSPDSLARDLALITDDDRFRITSITPYDLMPHTPHVETIAVLRCAHGGPPKRLDVKYLDVK